MRATLSLAAGAAVAAFGAGILGEYSFSGLAVIGAGVVFGLFVAEAVLAVRGEGGRAWAAVCAALTAAGLVWAAWMSNAHHLGDVEPEGWLAVLLGAGVAAVSGRRTATADDSPTETEPSPSPEKAGQPAPEETQ